MVRIADQKKIGKLIKLGKHTGLYLKSEYQYFPSLGTCWWGKQVYKVKANHIA